MVALLCLTFSQADAIPRRKSCPTKIAAMSHVKLSDSQLFDLFQRTLRKDPVAGDILVKQLNRIFLPTILRFVQPYEADELLQRSFLKVWKSNAFRDPDHFTRPYLRLMAQNTCINYVSRRHVESSLFVGDEDDRQFLSLAAPAVNLWASEQAERVRFAISQLEGNQRIVIEMKMEGKSGEEIAKAIGENFSAKAVKSLNSRAWKKLRELLAESDDE